MFCFALPCLTYMSYVWLWIGMFTACGLWAHIIPYAIQTHTNKHTHTYRVELVSALALIRLLVSLSLISLYTTCCVLCSALMLLICCVRFFFLCIPCASLLSVGIFHCWLLRLFLNAFGRVQPVWFTNPNESFVDLLFIYITHKVELYGLKMKKETLAHTHKQQYITQSVSAIVGSGGNVRSKSPCVIVIIFLYTQTNIRSYLCFWLL